VAAVLVAPLALPVVLRDERHRSQTAASEELNRLAIVAAKQARARVAPGDYLYTRSKDAYLSTTSGNASCSALVPHRREVWIAPNGSGRLLVEKEKPVFPGRRDRMRWPRAGRPSLGDVGRSDERFHKGGLHFQRFGRYSTDPNVLYDQLCQRARGHGPSTDAEMLLVGDLLRETAAPPRLRAALYRVAARIPGVTLRGDVTDPAGRRGVALARTTNGSGLLERTELIVDPQSSKLLGEREVLVERVDWVDAAPGTVIGASGLSRLGGRSFDLSKALKRER
jgi:hypothetical protein